EQLDWWHGGEVGDERLRDAGFSPDDPTLRAVVSLTEELIGFPRHLSQHVGGFVMTEGPLCETVPIENAAMPDRTFIEWDKDDLDALGLLKLDCLALGMLTCIHKAFRFIARRDEGTEGRRDDVRFGGMNNERGNEEYKWWPYNENGDLDVRQDQNFSGSGCMAEGNGSRQGCLRGNNVDARIGEVWTDDPDAASSCINTIQHRRRLCET